jgi:hypothetical protein
MVNHSLTAKKKKPRSIEARLDFLKPTPQGRGYEAFAD